jgi:anion-transporting  ArsA/GET3 family ATPase
VDRRKARQAEYLAKIQEDLGEWPLWRVTMREEDPVGTDAIRELGKSLWGTYGMLPETTHETMIEIDGGDAESSA